MGDIWINRGGNGYNDINVLVDSNILENIHWDSVSGGYQRRSGVSKLYAYIPYSLGLELGVSCSGTHDFGYNSMKVCIPKGLNQEGEYKQVYNKLCEIAGPQPICSTIAYRPLGFPPCTKRILKILDNLDGNTNRETLRNQIVKTDNYKSSTFCNALKSLEKQGKITITGAATKPRLQTIKKNI